MEDWRFSALSVSKHLVTVNDVGWYHFGHVGTKVRFQDYLLVENSYVRVVLRVLSFLNISEVTVNCDAKLKLEDTFDRKLLPSFDLLDEDQVVSTSSSLLKDSIRLLLREHIQGYIANEYKQLTFRFGYDMYLYLNTSMEPSIVREIVEDEGLVLRE